MIIPPDSCPTAIIATSRSLRSPTFPPNWGNSELILAHNDRPFGANQFYGPYDSWEHTNTYFVAGKQDLGKSTQVSFAYRHHRDRFVLFRENPLYYQNLHALAEFPGGAAQAARGSTTTPTSFMARKATATAFTAPIWGTTRAAGWRRTRLWMRAR